MTLTVYNPRISNPPARPAVTSILPIVIIGLLGPSVAPLVVAAAAKLHPTPLPDDARSRCGRKHSRLFVISQWRRCVDCGTRPPTHLVVLEFLSPFPLIAVYATSGLTLLSAMTLAATLLLIAIALIDLEHRVVPNRAVIYGVAVSLVAAPFWPELGMTRTFLGNEGPLGSLANSLLAAAGAFLLLLAVHLARPRSLGGGDVKYAFLLGLLLGYPGIITAGLVTAAAAGAYALYLLTIRRARLAHPIPYALFMSAGAIPALLWGHWLFDVYLALLRGG